MQLFPGLNASYELLFPLENLKKTTPHLLLNIETSPCRGGGISLGGGLEWV